MFPREEVPRLVREALLSAGKALPEIAAGRRGGRMPAGDPAQERHAERSVWHTKESIDEYVATRLKLRRSAWDGRRTGNDLQDATSRELRRLRKTGKLVGWGRRLNICRLADGHGLEAQERSMSAGERPPEPPEARWRSSRCTDKDRMDMFMWILGHGSKDNTYKFAMARALIELCGERDPGERGPLVIEYRELAGRFLRYYWRQVCVFRIRQHHHPKREAKVVRAILDVWGSETDGGSGNKPKGLGAVDDFDQLDKRDVKSVTDTILREVFGSERSKKGIVVPRFQKVKIGRWHEVVKKFYDYDDKRRVITVREDARRFFEKNRAILLDEVTFVWAKYLEAANGGLPGLLAKVEAAKTRPRRNAAAMKAAREEFLASKEECFYCGCKLDKGTIEADHFIPWSFIFDDQMWNLVPSCGCCNGRKGGMLPDEDAYVMLLERNGRHAGGTGRISESLGLLGRGGGGWKREMRARYDMCRDYRFGTVAIGELCGGRRGDPCRGRGSAGP